MRKRKEGREHKSRKVTIEIFMYNVKDSLDIYLDP